ncbi:DnaB-like helicase N-terminal domain-containing protein [Streptomyces sclerotialus]|uniref:replicative DNA helicase n=1 Tax=Streptomyces sclerotialus TaxID=1957 RepID=UPI00068A6CD7
MSAPPPPRYDNVRALPSVPEPRTDRTPPQNLEAEQSVLGAMLLSAEAIAEVVETLDSGDYYRPAHETIHRAVCELHDQGQPADPITVADHLAKRGDLGRVGGASYLHTLIQAVPTTAHAEHYAEIVREKAERRRLIEAGMRLVQAASSADTDTDQLRAAVAQQVTELTARPNDTASTDVTPSGPPNPSTTGSRASTAPTGPAPPRTRTSSAAGSARRSARWTPPPRPTPSQSS